MKLYGTYTDKPDGVRDKTAEKMMIQFSETAAPLKEGNYEAKKEARRLSISTVVNKTSN